MNDNQLVVTNGKSTDLITFDDDKVALIKRTTAPTATDDELELFLHQCKRTGLDPLARQIYFQKYNTKNGPKVSIITGIDGYRVVADRTGVYAGSDEPQFEGTKGETRYNESKDVPVKATVTVWKIVGNKRVPFTASAYWDEYYPGDKKGHMWFKMPHVMLGKVAEAQALRKAFPADLSGVYTRDEMAQAEADWEAVEVEQPTIEPQSEPPKRQPKRNGSKPKQQTTDGTDWSQVEEAPGNVADFAHWFAAKHPYYKDNYHVVGALRKKWDNIGVTFGQRDVVDYEKYLDEYAKQKADEEA